MLAELLKNTEWKEKLALEFDKKYFKDLEKFIEQEQQNYTLFPSSERVFEALENTPLSRVKAVIMGQDPYHGAGQAHGLSFSVQKGVKIPPSLKNIFKELHCDLGILPANHGFLESWAKEGVLLLNATLTVRAHEAASHQRKGWETFTDQIIKILSQSSQPIVFLLWGNYAASKEVFIDATKHLILKAPHPSPLSAYNGFFGCKHFSKTNEFLIQNAIKPIVWALSER
jgi:uracil-DNA glycosylase